MADRIWFITGASRGIGAQTVEAALGAGDRVVATGRSRESMIARFGEQDGLLLLEMDVTDEPAVFRAIERAKDHFGRLDIVLNNAGYGMLGAIEEMTMEEFRTCMETNFFGTLLVCKAAIPHLRAQGSGHIVNVTSAGGFASVAGFGAYCAAKFGVEGLTETLRYELEPFGIRVTAVEPGYVRSDFGNDTSLVIVPNVEPAYGDTVGQIRRVIASGGFPQPGDPAKVARAIVDLSRLPNPPAWLPLGADAIDIIETKQARVQKDIGAWRELACSTYF